jgi:hypothetical protein
MAFAIMSDEESTSSKGKKSKGSTAETSVVQVEDHGWKKEGSCKVAVQLSPPYKIDPRTNQFITTAEVDGFRWNKHVSDGTKEDENGKDYEIYLPVGVTPSQHGVKI